MCAHVLTCMCHISWAAPDGLAGLCDSQAVVEPHMLTGVERGETEVAPARCDPGVPRHRNKTCVRRASEPGDVGGVWGVAGEMQRAVGWHSLADWLLQYVLRDYSERKRGREC